MELAWAWHAHIPTVVIIEDDNMHNHCMLNECMSYRVKTLEQAAFYFADDVKNNDSLINLITQNKLFWKTIFEEDISVVEGMQKGRQGRSFDGGKFSPVMDMATHNFHKWVADELLKDKSTQY